MKQRSPAVSALLSAFVPFYIIYWLYDTAASIRQRGVSAPPLKLILGPLLLLIALLILQMSVRFVTSGSGSTGAFITIVNIASLTLGILAMLGVLFLPLYYYYKFSQASSHVTNGTISSLIAFVLFLVFSPIAVYLIQDGLNKVSASPPAQAFVY